jgi:translation initiation factor IF-1
VVVDFLPNATYVVEVEGTRQRVRAHLAPATKLNATRLRVKDRVLVAVSPHDPGRGRITKWLGSGGE